MDSQHELVFFTKPNCMLCEDVKEKLVKFTPFFKITEVDITKPENAHLFGKYRYEIPVLELKGCFIMKNKNIDVEALTKYI